MLNSYPLSTANVYTREVDVSSQVLHMPHPKSREAPGARKQRAMPGDKTPDDILVGKNIRARIEAAAGTSLPARGAQAELARRISVSTTTMWRYLDGHHAPLDKLRLIARELGCEVGDLLVGTDQEQQSEPSSLTHDDYMRIARLALAAAEENTPEAHERFNTAIRTHASRLRTKR